MNLLIAMMNSTYEDVKARVKLEIMLQQYNLSREYGSRLPPPLNIFSFISALLRYVYQGLQTQKESSDETRKDQENQANDKEEELKLMVHFSSCSCEISFSFVSQYWIPKKCSEIYIYT